MTTMPPTREYLARFFWWSLIEIAAWPVPGIVGSRMSFGVPLVAVRLQQEADEEHDCGYDKSQYSYHRSGREELVKDDCSVLVGGFAVMAPDAQRDEAENPVSDGEFAGRVPSRPQVSEGYKQRQDSDSKRTEDRPPPRRPHAVWPSGQVSTLVRSVA